MVRGVFSIIVLALVVAFVALNWSALATPMSLSLGVGTVHAPLGLLMLSLIGLLGVLFAVWAITMLAESHRQGRELQAQRELADKAEASRFTELRGFLHDELRRMADDHRIAQEQSTNTLSAHLAELEDRLERGRGSTAAELPRPADARLPAQR